MKFHLIWETLDGEQCVESECGYPGPQDDCACPDNGLALAWDMSAAVKPEQA